jgi:two-component system sensor histidine kinase/response regulator
MTEPASRHEVMIVDDNPNNLRLLEDMLLSQGHVVRSFPLGRLALNAAQKSPPDLILLDINMPEMNGYEVCARFKESSTTRDVPVIFLSALNDVKDKVKAFQAGGVDYVSKPFQFEEVQARVDTQLRLHLLQRQLRQYNETLEETVRKRTEELEQAHASLRLLDDAKGEFLRLISHELRTPLHGLLGSFELMLMDLPDSVRAGEMWQTFESSRSRLVSIVEDALLLTEIGVRKPQHGKAPCVVPSVRSALHRACDDATMTARTARVSLIPAEVAPGSEDWSIVGEERLLVRALRSLIETAVRLSAPGDKIRLTAGCPAILIDGGGAGLAEGIPPGLFDMFPASAPASKANMLEELGLGPAVADRLLRLLGADLRVERIPGPEPGLRFAASWKQS